MCEIHVCIVSSIYDLLKKYHIIMLIIMILEFLDSVYVRKSRVYYLYCLVEVKVFIVSCRSFESF